MSQGTIRVACAAQEDSGYRTLSPFHKLPQGGVGLGTLAASAEAAGRAGQQFAWVQIQASQLVSWGWAVRLNWGSGLGSPIFPSGCEGKLGVALESLQGLRDLT